MREIKKRLDEIDSINIEYSKDLLIKKIGLIEDLLSDLDMENTASEEQFYLVLQRVDWLAQEVGATKGLDSANIEKPLVLKAMDIAKRNLSNKKEIIQILKLGSSYLTSSPILQSEIKNQIQQMEKD